MRLFSLIILWRSSFNFFICLITIFICISSLFHLKWENLLLCPRMELDILITCSWFQAAQGVVKQYVASTFSHLLRDISGYYYNFNEVVFLQLRIRSKWNLIQCFFFFFSFFCVCWYNCYCTVRDNSTIEESCYGITSLVWELHVFVWPKSQGQIIIT